MVSSTQVQFRVRQGDKMHSPAQQGPATLLSCTSIYLVVCGLFLTTRAIYLVVCGRFLTTRVLKLQGPIGSMERQFHPLVEVKEENNILSFSRLADSKEASALHGMSRYASVLSRGKTTCHPLSVLDCERLAGTHQTTCQKYRIKELGEELP